MKAYTQKKNQPHQSLPIIKRSRPGLLATGQEVHPVTRLQRTIGNQAVQRLRQANAEPLNVGSNSPATNRFAHDFSRIPVHPEAAVKLQAKLTVNTPGDKHEREADRVAAQVTSMSEPQICRFCACGGTCSKCRNKQGTHEHIQPKPVGANHSGPISAPTIVNEVIRSSGQPLDRTTRGFMESRLGQDFSNVRVHTDPRAEDSATAVGAKAYTVGQHIAFAAGQYRPQLKEGRQLLAHELTHVVQQNYAAEKIQRQPDTKAKTDQNYTKLVQDIIAVFKAGVTKYKDADPLSIPSGFLDGTFNDWYAKITEAEKLIDDHLSGNVTLRKDLRSAYISAIRTLISISANGGDVADVYRKNTGRIPMWAWSTPHHMEPGITTPMAEGRSVSAQGTVKFSTNDFDVEILKDIIDPTLKMAGSTDYTIDWRGGKINWKWAGSPKKVTSFSAPTKPLVQIRTSYVSKESATKTSGYGKGTTPEDIAGGKVTAKSTSLGFHEGSHGLNYVEFVETHPPPKFTGTVGMTESQFRLAITKWKTQAEAYASQVGKFSTKETDCVGTTRDEYNRANESTGGEFTLVCV